MNRRSLFQAALAITVGLLAPPIRAARALVAVKKRWIHHPPVPLHANPELNPAYWGQIVGRVIRPAKSPRVRIHPGSMDYVDVLEDTGNGECALEARWAVEAYQEEQRQFYADCNAERAKWYEEEGRLKRPGLYSNVPDGELLEREAELARNLLERRLPALDDLRALGDVTAKLLGRTKP